MRDSRCVSLPREATGICCHEKIGKAISGASERFEDRHRVFDKRCARRPLQSRILRSANFPFFVLLAPEPGLKINIQQ
jgi:hypothetical protein